MSDKIDSNKTLTQTIIIKKYNDESHNIKINTYDENKCNYITQINNNIVIQNVNSNNKDSFGDRFLNNLFHELF